MTARAYRTADRPSPDHPGASTALARLWLADMDPTRGSPVGARRATVPILMYHQVDPDRSGPLRPWTVTPARFATHLQVLRRLGYRSITMDELAAARDGRSSLPPRPIAITFDDGFAAAVRHALPVLADNGFIATFYVVAGLVGGTSAWLRTEIGTDAPLADAAAIRSLESAGSRAEAHSLTHPRLAGLDADRLRTELVDSRARLEDLLGRPVRHLAYPHGSVDRAARDMAAEAGYVTGVTTVVGRAGPQHDALQLPRLHPDGRDSALDLAVRLQLGSSARELMLDRPRKWIRDRRR